MSFYVFCVNSGFSDQATANATNGIEIKAIICKITVSCGLATSGSAIIHGKGSVTINQMPTKRQIISTFRFVFGFIIPLCSLRI